MDEISGSIAPLMKSRSSVKDEITGHGSSRSAFVTREMRRQPKSIREGAVFRTRPVNSRATRSQELLPQLLSIGGVQRCSICNVPFTAHKGSCLRKGFLQPVERCTTLANRLIGKPYRIVSVRAPRFGPLPIESALEKQCGGANVRIYPAFL
jgi:hypothetical protein